jgi:hypothetical protein
MPSLRSQSAEHTLDIIPKRGIIKRNNKSFRSMKFFSKIRTKIQNVTYEVGDVSVYCSSITCNFNTWIMKVASLVPAACSYPYNRSRLYRNISSFIYDILDFSTNFMEKILLIVMFYICFYYSSFGNDINVLLAD